MQRIANFGVVCYWEGLVTKIRWDVEKSLWQYSFTNCTYGYIHRQSTFSLCVNLPYNLLYKQTHTYVHYANIHSPPSNMADPIISAPQAFFHWAGFTVRVEFLLLHYAFSFLFFLLTFLILLKLLQNGWRFLSVLYNFGQIMEAIVMSVMATWRLVVCI